VKSSIKILASLAPFALAACGDPKADEQGTVPGEVVADQLDKAAQQSSPAAKEVLEDAADQAERQDRVAPASEPGSLAQDALEKAGKATPTPKNT
jgi:sRNA-binding protein